MFTNINYISVTIYVLCILMLLILIGVIFWRIFGNKNNNSSIEKIGSTSKAMNDFILSFSKTDQTIFHNILFKNKFAKKKYSLIPLMIIKNKNIFIISDIIANSKITKVIFDNESNPEAIIGKKSNRILYINFNWYKEIIRYLESNFENFQYKIIVPILNESVEVENHSDVNYSYVSNFEDDIDAKTDKEEVNEIQLKKLINKIKKINLFNLKKNADEVKNV